MTRRFPTLLDELWFKQLPEEDKQKIFRILRMELANTPQAYHVMERLERKYG